MSWLLLPDGHGGTALTILLRTTLVLLYISNFILYTLAFRHVMQKVYNNLIRFVIASMLFVLMLVLLGFLFPILIILFDVLGYFCLEDIGITSLLFPEVYLFPILYFVIAVVLLGMFIMQIVMLIYGVKKPTDNDSKRWLCITYFVPIIGSILYLCRSRNKNT